jgi:H/ACA ribonucleoprotein complex subunit 2
MSSDKLRKKVLKLTKNLQKEKKLKRGVKEVVKAIRKGAKG